MVNNDMAMKSADIHWPEGFSPADADLFAHNEVFIDAPTSTVWQHIIAAEKWPEWYPNSHHVQIVDNLTGELQEGTEFEWDTFGVHIDSRVAEFVPYSRLGWFGDGNGFYAYHTWLLTDEANGCHVVMEEVGKGPGAIALRDSDVDAMHIGHALWNSRLKALAESS
jgi:uncharacterized protein YndB with AHSA1/START domain